MHFSAQIESIETCLVKSLRLVGRNQRLAFAMGAIFCFAVFTAWLASQIAGFPTASVQDEFGYLLNGEIYASGRLAMPPHPMGYFFETLHQLQWPSYVSKYPPGQGLVLALGYVLGEPIYGIWISIGAMSASITWMLAGFCRVRWAFIGGVVTGIWLGGFCYWAQSYWGGALTATGAAMVWGGARRAWCSPRAGALCAIGTGTAILLLSRPFDGLLACLVPGALLAANYTRKYKQGKLTVRPALMSALLAPVLLAGAFQLACNKASTGSPWRMAYSEYRQQYDRNPIFIWEKPEVPPDYNHSRMEAFDILVQENASRHAFPFGADLWARLTSLNNFYLGGAGILMIAYLCIAPSRWHLWASAGILASMASIVLVYAFNYHYLAAGVAPLAIITVGALRWIYVRFNTRFNLLALAGIILLAVLALGRGESADMRKTVLELKAHREALVGKLQAERGEHLVLVRYERGVDPHVEYVFNGANIDRQKTIWARWTSDAGKRGLFDYYSGRRLWMLTVRKQGAPLLREFNWVADKSKE